LKYKFVPLGVTDQPPTFAKLVAVVALVEFVAFVTAVAPI
jgi:hypothetical protein